MAASNTTVAVQHYLDALKLHRGDESAAPIVRDLLGAATRRLHQLCASLLARNYPRLARPPLNLHADEMLSSVVERLLKALREARPGNVRQFFSLANQHMRWEVNDLARRLDRLTPVIEVRDEPAASPESTAGTASAVTVRILDAIEHLPEHEREVFDLVRVQGLTHQEAAQILDVTTKTIQRRLNRALLLLAEQLGDLRVDRAACATSGDG